MKKTPFSYSTLVIFLLLIFYSIPAQGQLSPRNANYDIKVSLDANKKILNGSETLTWRNITSAPAEELQFHLYLNAFKNTKSTFMVESGMRHRGFSVEKEDTLSWGWTDISSFRLSDGTDLTEEIEFIQPDDENENDETVIRVIPPQPVLPGESISINIDFTAKLPKIMARTGFSDEYYLVGQWFPKIGVFEDAGQRGRESAGWNCHQFHANSEFYSDYGVYNVEITLPQKFIVGATGVLVEEIENEDDTKTLKFVAEDVVDFAWTASPLFEVVEDKWKNVNIRLMLQPQHLSQADRHIQSAKNAFEYFEEHLGEYPYPSMTIVDPPFRGLGSAGMEYPMFITAGCIWGIPDKLRFTEMVTIHELGHNYFMGILASNEFEEAWLDEGFNTYFENRILSHYYGEKHSMVDLFGFHMGDKESARRNYTGMRNPYRAILSKWSWDYPDGAYGIASYQKPGVVLATLQNLVGDETTDKIFKAYYDKWKFKHPSAQDFFDVVNEVVSNDTSFEYGSDMNWFFDQAVKTGEICDYQVSSISSSYTQKNWGIFGSGKNKSFVSADDSDTVKYMYKTKTVLIRAGEVQIPQEILIHFEGGEEILEKWDGKSRTKSFSYQREDRIEWVQIDPERKVLLDVNLSNNSLNTKRETGAVWKYAAKVLFWAQSTMTSLFF